MGTLELLTGQEFSEGKGVRAKKYNARAKKSNAKAKKDNARGKKI